MIYTVTFNPSLDYIVSVDDFKLGLTNRTSSELMLPGGKGINVSTVLMNLGIENTALGFTAGFVGKEIIRRLHEMCIRDRYLNDARLNYACHRLENTSDSITNICLDSGFESQRTFNRVFKERYKISPSDYRSTCLKDMLS